jgi:cytochrome c
MTLVAGRICRLRVHARTEKLLTDPLELANWCAVSDRPRLLPALYFYRSQRNQSRTPSVEKATLTGSCTWFRTTAPTTAITTAATHAMIKLGITAFLSQVLVQGRIPHLAISSAWQCRTRRSPKLPLARGVAGAGPTRFSLIYLLLLAGTVSVCPPAFAQLSGHGGAVRALAVSAAGTMALSGSFDSSAIRWSLRREVAEQVLRLHESAVNAVAFLNDGRAVTAGADAMIGIWTPGNPAPDAILEGHNGPVAALAVSPDGMTLASASWDRTVRLWPLAGGAPTVLEGHQQSANGLAFTADGKSLVSAGYDATVRIWPLRSKGAPLVATLPRPLNAVVVAPDGEIATAGADGQIYFLSPEGRRSGVVAASSSPITSLAITAEGGRIAAASTNGTLAIIDRKTHSLARSLARSGLPIWAVAFAPDGRTLLSGGGDRIIHRWDAETGQSNDAVAIGSPEDPLGAYAGNPGAQVFRACVACHTLSPGEGDRAGPTLHGLFGRRIATLPGYNFSAALRQFDIVWTPKTVAKLFEIGPAEYTPGTKMPEQRIGREEDRDALVNFLEQATK